MNEPAPFAPLTLAARPAQLRASQFVEGEFPMKSLIAVLFVLFSIVPVAAQSFDKDDIKGFAQAADALEKSKVFEEGAGGDNPSLMERLNPFDGMGAMFGIGGQQGPTDEEMDMMFSAAGEVMMHRSMAAIIQELPEGYEAYEGEMERIVTEAGFESIDDWATKSDAITAAMMANSLAPIIDELADGSLLEETRKEAQSIISGPSFDDIKRKARNALVARAFAAAGIPGGQQFLGEEFADSELDLLQELENMIMRKVFSGALKNAMGMLDSPMFQRITKVALVTPEEDIEFLRKNKKLLPRDMRWDD
ncbi:MAG: hypothetical protein AAFY84_02695 [Pseudomonadota bacterium]